MLKKRRMLKFASLVATGGLAFSFVGNCAEGIPRGIGQTIGTGVVLGGAAAVGGQALQQFLNNLNLGNLFGGGG